MAQFTDAGKFAIGCEKQVMNKKSRGLHVCAGRGIWLSYSVSG